VAHPAKEARDRAQLAWPGATVVERRRNSIKHQHPLNPNKFMLDLGIGPMHFGPSEDQEINTAWQPGIAPWDFQMTQAGFNALALSNFSSGQIVKYVHPGSGENIAFQPQQLQYTNDLNQIQAIANPQSVNAVVQDDVLFWQGAFGPGFDIRWQAQTARLDKRLVVDQASRWPTPTAQIIAGGNPIARLQFIFQVSTGIDIFVNGVLWTRQPNSIRDTQTYVEFRLQGTGEVLWSFNLPRSNAAPVEDQDPDELLGTFRLRRTGPNLFVEHRIPIAWLQAADYPIEIDTTIDEQVGASDGDAFQATSDAVTVGSATPNVDSATEHAGHRFTTVAIPKPATINVASFGVTILADFVDEPIHRLRGQLSATPAAFTTTSNDIDARTRTSATVQWNSTDLGAGTDEFWEWGASVAGVGNGANINAIIQEIVDLAGWASNNNLVLIYEQHTGDGQRDLQIYHYDGSTTFAPKLHIEYTAGVALVIADGTHAHNAENVVLTQHHVLTIQDASHSHSAENISLTQHHILVIQDAIHTHSAESPTLVVHYILVIQDASHSHSAESLVLIQHHVLAIQDASHAHTADNITLVQHHVLIIQDAAHAHTAENLTLVHHHILVIQDAVHSHTADNLDLVQHLTLSIQDASHSHTAESPTLIQHHVLIVQDATHAHSAESPTLIQHHILVIQDASHAHSAETPTLVYHYILTIQDALHSHTAENLDLVQHHVLTIQDALHSHTAENIALIQNHVLAIQDALHGHTADNIILGVAGVLAIQDALHSHSADNIALIQHHVLAVQDALHSHSADSLVLIQHHLLAIADALHAHTADSLVLVQHHLLAIADALHAHSAENLTLTQQHVLAIADALHVHLADNITLSGPAVLVIQDALHAHLANNIVLGGVEVPGGILISDLIRRRKEEFIFTPDEEEVFMVAIE